MSSDRQREWALRAVRLLIEDVDCGYGILTIVGGPSNKTWSNWISNVASSSLFSFEKQSSAILQPVKRHRAIVPCRMSTCFRRLMIARWISFSLSRRFSTVKAQRYNAMPLTFIFFFFFFPWIWRYATCRISLSSLSTEISNIIGFLSLSEENNNLDLLLSKVFTSFQLYICVYI